MSLQKIPHDITRYMNNSVELLNLANRMRIGTVTGTSKVSPTMTANNAPSPYVVSADSEMSASYSAWKAMNGSNAIGTDCWTGAVGSMPGTWWKIDLSTNAMVNGYKISGHYDNLYYPTAWTFNGSTDNTNWTELDSKTGQTLSGSLSSMYIFSNTNSYRYYKLVFSANNGGQARAIIGELELHYISSIYHNYIGA